LEEVIFNQSIAFCILQYKMLILLVNWIRNGGQKKGETVEVSP